MSWAGEGGGAFSLTEEKSSFQMEIMQKRGGKNRRNGMQFQQRNQGSPSFAINNARRPFFF